MVEQPEDARVWRAPSIIDVAREAGVSAQTVSRVANGMDIVRPVTRDKVLAAMDRLGYRPNSAARALKTGRFRTLGVIMSELSSYGNTRTLEAFASEASKAGYSLALTPLWTIAQAGLTGALTRIADQAVDGLIVVLEEHELLKSDLKRIAKIPTVVVTAGRSHPYVAIDTDQAQGARLATEHLLSLGHETVWHVRGPERSHGARNRAQAWADTLREHGRVVPPVMPGDWSPASGYAAGKRLAADPRGDGDLRVQRRDGAGSHARTARGRTRRARLGQRRRLRRHGALRRLPAAADHGAPVLRPCRHRGGRHAHRPDRAPEAHHRRPGAHRADRAGEHRAAPGIGDGAGRLSRA